MVEPLDGNAIAGELFEIFGREMTAATGACSSCGATSQVAQLRVYMQAPGAVARCPGCGEVVIVIVDIRGTLRIDTSGFGLVDPQMAAPPADRPAGS
jgi:predicted RNA-binding Zn-ribbon protein involved in translation (DUF1610 family)